MKPFKQSSIFQAALVALALVPLILFAYLGQFSRMMSDDYCAIGVGRDMGAWDYMLYKIDTWAGSYANWFFKGAVAPLDALLPRITPTLIIVLWLVGLFWLIYEGLARLGIASSRRTIAAAAAALGVAAVINAFHSPQSFYWYAASTHYTLPLAVLTVYLALAFWTERRRENRTLFAGVILGAALCFVTAGASEIFVAFQLAFLTLCLLVCFALPGRSYVPVLAAGGLATLAGLVIQASAPGIAVRTAVDAEQVGQPIRAMAPLVTETLRLTFEYIGHPPRFAGFVMMLGLGLLAVLLAYKPRPVKTAQSIRLVRQGLWLALILQLIFLPILWNHSSDSPRFLGRFSGGYAIVVGLNLLLVLGLLAMIWQRRRIKAGGWRGVGGGLLIMAAALFGLTQFRSIHYRAASYLFISFLMCIGLFFALFWTASARRWGLLALCSSGMGLVCMAVIVGTGLFGRGFITTRILAPGVYVIVMSGLLWGMCMGCLVKQRGQNSRWLKAGSLAWVVIIGVGMVAGQAALVPDFSRYATAWDERHLEIIDQRDRGERVIKVAPLDYDLADYLDIVTLAQDPANRCAKGYYRLDAIVVTDG